MLKGSSAIGNMSNFTLIYTYKKFVATPLSKMVIVLMRLKQEQTMSLHLHKSTKQV